MTISSSLEALKRAGVSVFERGWLSSNNVLIRGVNGPTALVDSGHCSHTQQTLLLVESVLEAVPLDLLLNTHLHSDHCGGNAALQARYADLRTFIPPGQALAVEQWDAHALSYIPTGQQCPRFVFDGLLAPGQELQLGDRPWQIHGAKGHDPHSIVLFQPEGKLLISADALWQNGFGVVFPELEGKSAFEEVEETLSLIESLGPAVVIPGHGIVFEDVSDALVRARSRLKRFKASPEQHLRHAQKVLIKFHLMECQAIKQEALLRWAQQTPYLAKVIPETLQAEATEWLEGLLSELVRSQALRREGQWVHNI
jgi:glyoxylase-like metal-dependent hydrolase (beta-lactamase superfamily II)